MFEIPYYPETIKKTITAFGALFSNVQVIRRNGTGTTVEVVKVPIAYGPKEKFINRIDADPELDSGVYITLPRLAFEVTGYSFNSAEMTNRHNKIKCMKPDGSSFMHSPVPYDIQISLYALTKGTEDGLAIIEQVLPLFAPEYTMTINAIPEMNVTLDVPITMNGVSVQDDYESDFATRRLVIHTFDFTLKAKMFGPIHGAAGLIYRTETSLTNPINAEHVSVANPATGQITLDEWNLI